MVSALAQGMGAEDSSEAFASSDTSVSSISSLVSFRMCKFSIRETCRVWCGSEGEWR